MPFPFSAISSSMKSYENWRWFTPKAVALITGISMIFKISELASGRAAEQLLEHFSDPENLQELFACIKRAIDDGVEIGPDLIAALFNCVMEQVKPMLDNGFKRAAAIEFASVVTPYVIAKTGFFGYDKYKEIRAAKESKSEDNGQALLESHGAVPATRSHSLGV